MEEKLKIGFPLEKPDILLEWNKPLNELAEKSGGVWMNDRFVWPPVTYFNGLNFPLFSKNGIEQNDPFTEMSAYIGLDEDGLWSDGASITGFEKTTAHLVTLLGEPTNVQIKDQSGAESRSWNFGNIHIELSLIEQFTLRCYLTVGIES